MIEVLMFSAVVGGWIAMIAIEVWKEKEEEELRKQTEREKWKDVKFWWEK